MLQVGYKVHCIAGNVQEKGVGLVGGYRIGNVQLVDIGRRNEATQTGAHLLVYRGNRATLPAQEKPHYSIVLRRARRFSATSTACSKLEVWKVSRRFPRK